MAVKSMSGTTVVMRDFIPFIIGRKSRLVSTVWASLMMIEPMRSEWSLIQLGMGCQHFNFPPVDGGVSLTL